MTAAIMDNQSTFFWTRGDKIEKAADAMLQWSLNMGVGPALEKASERVGELAKEAQAVADNMKEI